ncbi:MAG TPA: hypothetical protein VM536_13680, partial [Chloroflexia bacterium]|nr:hypothetical protein [Chloroflexia bacterium]
GPDDLVLVGLADRGLAVPLLRGPLLDGLLAAPDRAVLIARAVQPLDLANYRARMQAQPAAELSAEQWFVENTYHPEEFADTTRWLAARTERRAHISLVLPTRNDAAKVGPFLLALRRALQAQPETALVDEILVVDAASQDDTAAQAAATGVPVRRVTRVGTGPLGAPSPSELLREALNLAAGNILVWLDPKAGYMHPGTVPALIGPLLHDPNVLLVKPFVTEPSPERPEGSRDPRFAPLTVADLLALPWPELAAVPLYGWWRAFYPRLGAVMQPLGTVFAARAGLLRELLPALESFEATLATGDSAEAAISPATAFLAGMLLETAARHSTRAIAQVEVAERARGRARRAVASPDTRQLRQIGDLLTFFATRPDSVHQQREIARLRDRVLTASS